MNTVRFQNTFLNDHRERKMQWFSQSTAEVQKYRPSVLGHSPNYFISSSVPCFVPVSVFPLSVVQITPNTQCKTTWSTPLDQRISPVQSATVVFEPTHAKYIYFFWFLFLVLFSEIEATSTTCGMMQARLQRKLLQFMVAMARPTLPPGVPSTLRTWKVAWK